tara:strand:- start:7470 stop:8348 length:879 start_codon:yes stop_codon:yes gene_type:complete
MKIIVSGSNSQIAHVLKKTEIPNFLNFYFFDKNEFDITNYQTCRLKINEIKPEIIINCAAYTDVKNAELQKSIANEINNESLKNLSELANINNSLLIHFSTDYVFDGKKGKQYNETDLTNPISYYGYTKLMGEKNIIKTCNKYIILRVSWLFSEFKNNFVNYALNKFKNNEDILAVKDLYSIPTSARTICNFLINIIINKKIFKFNNKIYHFCNSGSVVSWHDFANYIYILSKEYNNTNSKIIPQTAQIFFKNNIRPNYSAMNNLIVQNDFNFQIENWKNSLNTLVFNYFKV